MNNAVRLGDTIKGRTTGEHSGHYRHTKKHGKVPVHRSGTIHGEISGNCSNNVYINNMPAAIEGATTTERDNCCSHGKGVVINGSKKVYINGKPAIRICDSVIPHNGHAKITSCSDNVFIGG